MALRWRHAWHLLWGLPGVVLVLALVLAVSPFVLLRSRAVRDWAVDLSRVAAVFSGPSRVRIDRVDRLHPTGVSLSGVRVESRSDSGWTPWLRIGRIEADLRPDDLLARRIFVSKLVVDSVDCDLTRAPSPLFARTRPKDGEADKRPLKLPSIRFATLAVRHVTVEAGGGRRWSGELELAGLQHRDGLVRGTLRRAALRTVPDTLSLALEDGLVEGKLGDRFTVSAVKVTAPGLRGRLDGGWQAAGSAPEGAGEIVGELGILAFEPAGLPLLRAYRLPIQADDRVEGTLRAHVALARGAPPHADLDVDLSGSLFGTGLDTLLVAVTASPDSAKLAGLRLRFGGMALQGEASVARAGRAEAVLRVMEIDLSAPPISRFAPGLPASDLSGEVRAEADSLGPRIRLRAALELEPGLLLGRPLSGLSIRGRLDPEVVEIEDLHTVELPEESPPMLVLRGTLDRAKQILQAKGTLHRLPLEDWVDPWLGNVVLEGRVSGPFEVRGPWRHPQAEADLGVVDGRAMEVYLDTLHVAGIRGGLNPLRLSGDLTARRLEVYHLRLDSLSGPLTVADTLTARLSAFRDTTQLFLGIRVLPATQGAVLFDSLALRAGSAPPLFLDGESRLRWAPNRVGIDSLRLRSSVGTVWGGGWLEPRAGQSGSEPFRFWTHAEGIDLRAVAGYLGLPAENLAGRGWVDFSGEGTVRSPVYRYRFEGEGLETFHWFWDRVALVGAAGEGVGFRLDSLRVTGSGYLGPLPGLDQVGPMMPGPPLLVRGDSLHLRFDLPWEQLLKALADTSRSAGVLGSAKLGGRLEVSGLPVAPLLAPFLSARRDARATTALNQSLDPMLGKIEVVRPAPAEDERQRPSGIGGTLDLTARLGGTGGDVAVDLDLMGRGVWVYQAWADSIRLLASARDSRLQIQELRWQMGDAELLARGDLGMRLSASPPGVRTTGQPGRLEADLEQADLALLSLVTGVVQDPVGQLNGRLTLDMKSGRPHLGGQLSVRDGAFRIPGREERFSRIEADGTIDSLGLHVEATGRLNQTGRVRASGVLRSLTHFDLQAKVEEAPVYETGNYRLLVEADLSARPAAGDTLRPRVTGQARVLEGLITQDLSKPPSRLPPKTPWLVELEVQVPGNFRLNQPYAVVDLGEGNLHVSFRWPYWNLAGSLQVLSGSYRLFNRNLRITSGTVTFEDTGQGPSPYLDLEAETDLAGSEEEGTIHVQLHVIGYPAKKELDVALSGSDSFGRDYTEAQLIERMSLGQLQSSQFGTFRSSDPTRQVLSSELVGQIERQLVGQLPWADRIQLEGQIGGEDPLWINVRPIVQPQWSVLYSQELTTSPGREVAVRYRLSNLLFLNAAVDRRRRDEGLPLDTYSLDLKLRFEY